MEATSAPAPALAVASVGSAGPTIDWPIIEYIDGTGKKVWACGWYHCRQQFTRRESANKHAEKRLCSAPGYLPKSSYRRAEPHDVHLRHRWSYRSDPPQATLTDTTPRLHEGGNSRAVVEAEAGNEIEDADEPVASHAAGGGAPNDDVKEKQEPATADQLRPVEVIVKKEVTEEKAEETVQEEDDEEKLGRKEGSEQVSFPRNSVTPATQQTGADLNRSANKSRGQAGAGTREDWGGLRRSGCGAPR